MNEDLIPKNGRWPTHKKFFTVTKPACSNINSHWPTGEISDSKSLYCLGSSLSETWLTDHGKKCERWTMKCLISQIKRMNLSSKSWSSIDAVSAGLNFTGIIVADGWKIDWRVGKTGDGETNMMLLIFSFLSICNKKNVVLWWAIRVSKNSANRALVI